MRGWRGSADTDSASLALYSADAFVCCVSGFIFILTCCDKGFFEYCKR